MSDEPHKERIWPVFVLAVGVVALGTWLAFVGAPNNVAASALDEPFITPLPPNPETTPVTTVELVAFGEARTMAVDLRQERRSGEDVVRTQLRFDLVESTPRVEGTRRVWERSYQNVSIVTTSNGQPFGADVASEVERLLETARVEVTAQATGEVESTRVVSAEAAQLRQVLSVIRQTLDLALPRIPRETVRPGEDWTWSIPVDVTATEPTSVDAGGKMNVRARVLGNVVDQHVIEMNFDGVVSLAITPGDEDGRSASTKASGSGRGIANWHAERGLVRSEMRWEQKGADTVTVVRAMISESSSTE